MKKLFILVLLLLLAVLTAGSGYAQSKIQADIPFAFTIVDKALLAGAYSAEQRVAIPAVVFLSGTENSRAIALTIGADVGPNRNVEPKLVFRRYGEQYFLAQVWMGAGNTLGREIPKSVKERYLARKAPEPELIYIAAKQGSVRNPFDLVATSRPMSVHRAAVGLPLLIRGAARALVCWDEGLKPLDPLRDATILIA